MARITKNGLLSGAVGNVVFVQNGAHQYVRSKPGKVKQSTETKKSASVFGKVSTRDKIYRQELIQNISLVTDSRYAARHRARMTKTLAATDADTNPSNNLNFQNPEALMGFDFNAAFLWAKCTQFYPEFSINAAGIVSCKIPEIVWQKQIKAPKNTKSAKLLLEAFAVNPNDEAMPLSVLSTFQANISAGQSQDAAIWSFDTDLHENWIVVIATLYFAGEHSTLSTIEKNAATYLWAKNKSSI